MVDARGVRARIGGCLKLEFRDLEGLTDWIRDLVTPVPGAGGYPVRCTRQAATVPNLRLEIEESCFENQLNSVQN